MGISSLCDVPVSATRMVVGKHRLDCHIDNDALFDGIGKRLRGFNYGPSLNMDSKDGLFWSARFIYRSDATLFNWHIWAAADDGGDLYVDGYIDEGGAHEVHFLDETIEASDTDDLSDTLSLAAAGLTNGNLYTITLYWDSEIADKYDDARIWVQDAYCTYTGASSYTVPPAIVDTGTSATTEWDAWRANDLYFEAMLPHFPAGAITEDTSNPIWCGWLPERWGRIYYKVTTDMANIGDQVTIVYGTGTANETTETLTATSTDPETWEDYFDVSYAAYIEGTLREVRVAIAAGDAGTVTVSYIRNCPNGTESPATAIHAISLAAGDMPYGDTTDNRLAYLNSNDAHLNATYAIEKRQDFAVTSTNATTYPLVGYSFVRVGDTLNYNVKSVTMTWGTSGAHTLTDNDDDLPACGYHTLDLNSVEGLAYGMIYYIEVEGPSAELNFAEETW